MLILNTHEIFKNTELIRFFYINKIKFCKLKLNHSIIFQTWILRQQLSYSVVIDWYLFIVCWLPNLEQIWTGIKYFYYCIVHLFQAKCCVTNEADAELALQVSNALTQALLQYRMRNMPQSNVSIYYFYYFLNFRKC